MVNATYAALIVSPKPEKMADKAAEIALHYLREPSVVTGLGVAAGLAMYYVGSRPQPQDCPVDPQQQSIELPVNNCLFVFEFPYRVRGKSTVTITAKGTINTINYDTIQGRKELILQFSKLNYTCFVGDPFSETFK